MAGRKVVKRAYRNGTVKYRPEGQAGFDTSVTLERDGLIRRESDGFTVLDANNLRVVCWQIGANESLRAKGLREPFPGISAPTLNVIAHKNKRRRREPRVKRP